MAAYVGYDYHIDTFGGAAIPQADFERLAVRASREVDKITMYRIQNTDNPDGYPVDNKVKNAVCAVAEVLFRRDAIIEGSGGGLIKSETVGNRTVSLNVMDADKLDAYWRSEVWQAAREFLVTTGLLYRGIGRTCGL